MLKAEGKINNAAIAAGIAKNLTFMYFPSFVIKICDESHPPHWIVFVAKVFFWFSKPLNGEHCWAPYTGPWSFNRSGGLLCHYLWCVSSANQQGARDSSSTTMGNNGVKRDFRRTNSRFFRIFLTVCAGTLLNWLIHTHSTPILRHILKYVRFGIK